MQIALFSDVHANLHALDAVLAHIAATPVPSYHLGDLVGYSAFPNEVVQRLQDVGVAGIAGNYDSTVAHDAPHCGCRSESPEQEALAHQSYDFTRQHCTPTTKQFLGALPFSLEIRPFGGHASGPRLVLVHGTPTLNTVYWTDDRSDDFCRKMAAHVGLRAGDVIAFGHTHRPWHRTVDDMHFVNTGSVGRPKDGDWRAGYVRITFPERIATAGAPSLANGNAEEPRSALQVEFVRVPYDVDAACAAVHAAGLPDAFARQLRSGGSA